MDEVLSDEPSKLPLGDMDLALDDPSSAEEAQSVAPEGELLLDSNQTCKSPFSDF